MNSKKLEQLKKDIQEIQEFKAKLERRQVDFPLDSLSQKVIHKDLPVPTGAIAAPYTLITFDRLLDVTVNDKKYYLLTSSEY